MHTVTTHYSCSYLLSLHELNADFMNIFFIECRMEQIDRCQSALAAETVLS